MKACIAKLTNQHDYPDKHFALDCYTHDIEKLLRLAGLETSRKADSGVNPALALNWTIVKDWNERSRYERHSLAKARKLIDAITDDVNGVLPWIKVRW